MQNFRRETVLTQWAQIRSRAFADVMQELSADITEPFSLKGIESDALRAWEQTWKPLQTGKFEVGEWDWSVLAKQYLWKPGSFHLAIWSGTQLCGLAVGRPSDSRASLSVHYVEGSPDPKHPLKGKILALTIAAADAYGAALGANVLRLRDPADDLLKWYESVGFDLVWGDGRVKYCEKEID